MFGLNPRSITSRISKMANGINTLTTFYPEKQLGELSIDIGYPFQSVEDKTLN